MPYSTLVSAAILAQHLHEPNWVVFDCRFVLDKPELGYAAYRDGHIPGARYAHLDRDLAAPKLADTGRHPLPDSDDFARWLGRQGVRNQSQVVAYDDAGGVFAARLWWLLRWLGHEQAAVLDGGWQDWIGGGRSISKDDATPDTVSFQARPRVDSWFSTARVEEFLAAGDGLLVDARAQPRFAGEVEPIDPVAGHVPGALNQPFNGNLDESGRFKTADQLRRRFDSLLGATLPDRVVHMCGSGVTACHNLLAMEAAGLTGSRLYVGSWSEWITDPARPVARGQMEGR